MKLKTVQLAGFKSYDNHLEQNRIVLNDINILIGANGAGKSNFVSFLEMVSFIATDGLQKYAARNGYAQSLLYFGPKVTEEINGRLHLESETGASDDYEFSLSMSANGGLYFTREFIRFDYGNAYNSPYKKELSSGNAESRLIYGEVNNATAQVLLGYLKGFKVFHFNDTSLNARIRNKTYIGDSEYLRSDGGNLPAYLYKIKTAPSYVDYYQRILRYVRDAFPQFEEFSLNPSQAQGEDSYISLDWKAAGEDEIFGPHQLSDGTLRFIALAVLLLQPTEKAPLVIILDEPEIGLHPYAIRLLAQMIRIAGKNSQVIVSTQSPQLLNEFDCSDVLVTEYNLQRRSSSLHRLSADELSAWLDTYALGELWEKNVLGGNPI